MVGGSRHAMSLLHLDSRSRAGLEWIRLWARGHITHLKVRRKYLPRGQPFEPAEADLLRYLLDLEQCAKGLLETGTRRK